MAQPTNSENIEVSVYLDGVILSTLQYAPDQVVPDPKFEWEPGDEGRHEIKVVVCNCCACCVRTESVVVGDQVQLGRESCHNFTFNDYGSYPDATLTVLVKDAKGVVLQTFTDTSFSGGEFSFYLAKDGAYQVCYTVTKDTQTLYTNCFVVYDFCTIFECYKEILLDLTCAKFSECEKEAFNVALMNLLAFNTVGAAFFGSILISVDTSYGVLGLDEVDLGVLADVQYYYEQLLNICSNCNNPEIRDLTRPCGCN